MGQYQINYNFKRVVIAVSKWFLLCPYEIFFLHNIPRQTNEHPSISKAKLSKFRVGLSIHPLRIFISLIPACQTCPIAFKLGMMIAVTVNYSLIQILQSECLIPFIYLFLPAFNSLSLTHFKMFQIRIILSFLYPQ